MYICILTEEVRFILSEDNSCYVSSKALRCRIREKSLGMKKSTELHRPSPDYQSVNEESCMHSRVAPRSCMSEKTREGRSDILRPRRTGLFGNSMRRRASGDRYRHSILHMLRRLSPLTSFYHANQSSTPHSLLFVKAWPGNPIDVDLPLTGCSMLYV